MVGGVLMGFLGGMAFLVAEISGRMYPEGWARLSALLVFVGFNLTFFPQFILGYVACRAATAVSTGVPGAECALDGGRSVLAVGYLLPMIYFLWSLNTDPSPATIRGTPPAGVEDYVSAAHL